MLFGQGGKSKCALKAEREYHRIQRGKWEVERMIARYDQECGECKIIRPAKTASKQK